jgi:hypothetical protein
MRETNKAARDDHLRRRLEQSRVQRFVDWKKWGWKRVFVFAGGVAWGLSLLGQMEYHALGMLQSARVQDDATYGNWFSTQRCVWNGITAKETQRNCLEAAHQQAWSGLAWGFLSCWWNYKLAERLYSLGRLRGVNNHMALQLIVLVARVAALWSLDHSWLSNSAVPLNAAHGVMLIFLVLVSIDTSRPKISTNPPIDNHNLPPHSPPHQSTSRLLHRPPTHPRRSLNNSKTNLLRQHTRNINLPNLLSRPPALP